MKYSVWMKLNYAHADRFNKNEEKEFYNERNN